MAVAAPSAAHSHAVSRSATSRRCRCRTHCRRRAAARASGRHSRDRAARAAQAARRRRLPRPTTAARERPSLTSAASCAAPTVAGGPRGGGVPRRGRCEAWPGPMAGASWWPWWSGGSSTSAPRRRAPLATAAAAAAASRAAAAAARVGRGDVLDELDHAQPLEARALELVLGLAHGRHLLRVGAAVAVAVAVTVAAVAAEGGPRRAVRQTTQRVPRLRRAVAAEHVRRLVRDLVVGRLR